jgi:hypothetical protein
LLGEWRFGEKLKRVLYTSIALSHSFVLCDIALLQKAVVPEEGSLPMTPHSPLDGAKSKSTLAHMQAV